MFRFATLLICTAALVYAAACAALYLFQRSLIYFPQPRTIDTPVLQVHGDNADTPVLASVREREGAEAVLYFGGNAEDVSQSLAPLAHAFPAHALYLLHYRGYGGSGGKPSEAAIQHDALALFDRVHKQHPNITLVGRSLGSGVAVRLAAQRPAVRVVLVTPYDSLAALAAAQFPFMPVRWLLKDPFESNRYAAQVQAPVVLVVAEHDEVIPRASSEHLFARFRPGQATLAVLPGVSHNTVSSHPHYDSWLNGRR